ncbi:hypothetical protein DFR52_103422 [Hoeflea marina]|uniref:Uncharacterized protein n=1 Tax=Hoeflea marina TaxID=274592 RepID=A0A317PJM5_9HYPH|nr:hypothetical protein [Hoeflea marina]PWW00220.1 hypothetical protein DFR52_103422 [Hoeflea marina]
MTDDRILHLHAGTEKTGTTAIQSALETQRKTLADRSILYPASLGAGPHMQLTAACLDFSLESPILQEFAIDSDEWHAYFVKCVSAALRTEIRTSGANQVIISDEHINVNLLTPQSLEQIGLICEIPTHRIFPVIYFRRQDRLLESIMSEILKCLALQFLDYEDPLSLVPATDDRYDYLRILRNFTAVFPTSNMRLRSYTNLPSFNVVTDFFETIGYPDHADIVQVDRKNASIPKALFRPLLSIGRSALEHDLAALREEWRLMVQAAAVAFPGQTYRLGAEDRAAFLSRYADDNAELARQFPQLAPELYFSSETGAGPETECPVSMRRIPEAVQPAISQNALHQLEFAIAQAGRGC